MKKNLKVAVIQSAPVLFNKAATIKKTGMLVTDAVNNGANLVLFPEAFIPAYPRGLSFGTVVGSRSSEGKAPGFAIGTIPWRFRERIRKS